MVWSLSCKKEGGKNGGRGEEEGDEKRECRIIINIIVYIASEASPS